VRITTGPDGALWFTEQKTYSIGRISTEGKISEFRLRLGIVPFDITTGPGGALWFTTRKQLGRITTAGSISLWAIPGAKELEGLAMAADGSAWIADPPADVVHHFDPTAN
jgi:virginiamycin B lyase